MNENEIANNVSPSISIPKHVLEFIIAKGDNNIDGVLDVIVSNNYSASQLKRIRKFIKDSGADAEFALNVIKLESI